MPQGIAALLSHQPDGGLVETAEAMAAAVQEVKTGELTRASRAVVIDQIEVNEGQVIALLDDKLVCACDDFTEATLSLLKHAEAEAAELITLYYGAGLSHSEASTIADRVRETYSTQELQLVHGGQPHYDLIVSVE
jgi:dihydroxyacetone kinase-like predicted kinase